MGVLPLTLLKRVKEEAILQMDKPSIDTKQHLERHFFMVHFTSNHHKSKCHSGSDETDLYP